MTRTLMTSLAIFALTAAVGPLTAKADIHKHLDGLALKLAVQADEIRTEFALHYKHTAEYPHLVADANQVRAFANLVHQIAHHHGSPYTLDAYLNRLDTLFHHMESTVARIEHNALFHPHSGHIHGETSHVAAELAAMETTLHHLRADVKQLLPPPVVIHRPPVITHPGHGHNHGGIHGGFPGGGHPGHGHGHIHNKPNVVIGNNGVSFGNGRIRFRIGF